MVLPWAGQRGAAPYPKNSSDMPPLPGLCFCLSPTQTPGLPCCPQTRHSYFKLFKSPPELPISYRMESNSSAWHSKPLPIYLSISATGPCTHCLDIYCPPLGVPSAPAALLMGVVHSPPTCPVLPQPPPRPPESPLPTDRTDGLAGCSRPSCGF